MSKLPHVYLDANILLAKSAGPKIEPNQFPFAEQIFNQMKNGEMVAIISPITLMEIRNVLRQSKGKETNILAGMDNSERVDYVQHESNEGYNSLLKELIQMDSSVIFKINKKIDMNLLLIDALEITEQIRGKVKSKRECKRCGSTNVSYTQFKALGMDDALHALYAKEIGCDQLLTFDGDFKELANHSKILPLQIEVINPFSKK